MVVEKAAFEQYPPGMPMDETDVNLRAYIWNIPEEKLAQFDPSWTDDELMEWDENFKNDGSLLLVCSERDVEAGELRKVIGQYLEFKEKNGL